MTAVYVYGLVKEGEQLPAGLTGLGPSGRVWTITHGRVAAIVGDVPLDRPLGTRQDLVAHEAVLDSVAQATAVIPMRFPAVVEEQGVVDELLDPHQEEFAQLLDQLHGKVQFTLKGSYDQEAVLRELIDSDEQIRSLTEKVHDVPEDASYYDRVRLGELIVNALEDARDADQARLLEQLEGRAVATVSKEPPQPDDVVNASFLVDLDHTEDFETAVEEVGRQSGPRVRLRLLGPLAPYDFVAQE